MPLDETVVAGAAPEMLLREVQAVRDAVCMTADLLAMGIQSDKSRRRWKKILLNGPGGTVIVGANAAAVPCLARWPSRSPERSARQQSGTHRTSPTSSAF